MQFDTVRAHLTAALEAAGLPKGVIRVGQVSDAAHLATGIGAHVSVSGGRLKVEGTRLSDTLRRLCVGRVTFDVVITGQAKRAGAKAASAEDILVELLRYLAEHRLKDEQGNDVPFPAGGEARLSYQDAEGYLLGQDTLRVSLDADLSLYTTTPRVLVDLELQYRLDGGNPDE